MDHNLLNPFGQVIIVICLKHDFIHCCPCGELMIDKSAKRYYLLLGGPCGQLIRINILKHELVLCGLCGEVERSKPVDKCDLLLCGLCGEVVRSIPVKIRSNTLWSMWGVDQNKCLENISKHFVVCVGLWSEVNLFEKLFAFCGPCGEVAELNLFRYMNPYFIINVGRW